MVAPDLTVRPRGMTGLAQVLEPLTTRRRGVVSGSYTHAVPATRLEPGDTFAGYVIEQRLGAGGMGAVYKVRHPALKKSFALKILLESLTEDPSFAQRFQREMETVSQLDHPNIVATVDGGSVDGQVWFTMNYVPGSDAQHAIENQPGGLAPELVVQIVEKVCAALDHAHRKGIVHRDIKPANILLADGDGEQRVYLTDFGIAKAVNDLRPITTEGLAPMTIDYASPEQILGQDLDARTDLYSLGAAMFVLLTGRVPFPADSVLAKMNMHLNQPVPVPSMVNPLLPAGFNDVITRAMTKDRTQRFQHAPELARAARAALTPRTAAGTTPNWSPPVPAPPTKPQTARTPPPTSPLRDIETHSPATGTTRRRWLLPVLLAAALALTVGGIFAWVNRSDSGLATPSTTASSAGSSTGATMSPDASTAEDSSAGSTTPSAGSAESSETKVTPLTQLLSPAPTNEPRTINGAVTTAAPAFQLAPKNCPLGSQQIAVDLSGGFGRIAGGLQLNETAPAGTHTSFVISADDAVLMDGVLSVTKDATFDVAVPDNSSVLITLESLGQGSCETDDYLVFFTDALAYP